MTDSDKTPIINTTDKSELDKARNRMIAEGYRYRALDNHLSGSDSDDGNYGAQGKRGIMGEFMCMTAFLFRKLRVVYQTAIVTVKE